MHELPVHEGKTERPRVQPNTHEQDRRPRSEGDARFRLPRPSQGRLLRCIQPQHHLRAPSRGSLFGSITERRRQENPKEGKNADPNLNLNDAHGPCPFRRTNYQYYVAGVKQDSAERILGGGSLDLPFNHPPTGPVLARMSEAILRQDDTTTKNGSTAGAVARALSTSFAFMFKRPPLRFFRPTKVSTYTALQVMADERGKPLTLRFVRGIIRSEGPYRFFLNHFLPPLVANTTVGLALFTSYTLTEDRLKKSEAVPKLAVPALAGGIAGAAQSLVSAPLDNIRLLLLQKRRKDAASSSKVARFTGWLPLMKEALLPPFLKTTASDVANLSNSARLRLWASRGWSLTTLSILKDSVGFAAFFALFEVGRTVGRQIGSIVDDAFRRFFPTWKEDDEAGRAKARSWTGRIVQGVVIVLSGATAGWAYGVVAEPFEVMRQTIWETRMDWAERTRTAPHSSSTSSVRNAPKPPRPIKDPSHAKVHINDSTLRSRRYPRSLHPPHAPLRSDSGFSAFRARITRHRKRLKASQDPLLAKGLPSAWSIIRWRARQDGLLRWLFSGIIPLPVDEAEQRGRKSKRPVPQSFGGLTDGVGRQVKRLPTMAKFKSFVLTPYALGFFVYAVASGDLTESSA